MLEWNNLGSHVDGLEALFSLLQINNSIEHIDLRNNKIGGEDQSQILSNIIRNNKSLKSLDLKWN